MHFNMAEKYIRETEFRVGAQFVVGSVAGVHLTQSFAQVNIKQGEPFRVKEVPGKSDRIPSSQRFCR
jgi:hypothetical protein